MIYKLLRLEGLDYFVDSVLGIKESEDEIIIKINVKCYRLSIERRSSH